MLKVIYILFIILLALTVEAQNVSVNEYNQDRDGFGSVTIEPEPILLDSEDPLISNISNLSLPSRQQPTVNNITFYTVIRDDGPTNNDTNTDEEIQTSTINSRQSNPNYNQINYQQQQQQYPQQQQQKYYQPQQQQQIAPYNNNQQFQQYPQQQQQPNQGCTLAGCTPPHVDQRQYEANAQQYSYSNINFGNNQQQPQSQLQQQQQYNGPNQQIYGNSQTINSNQNSPPPGVYPGNYQGQPLMDPQQNQQTGGNSNFGGGGVITPNQQIQGQQEPGNLQQVSILNYSNNSGLEPVAERLTITQLPNGTFINVERTQSSTGQGGSNTNGVPGYLPQQQPLNNNNQFQNPNTIGSSGIIYGQGNPPLYNQQQQQQQEYPPGFNPQDQTIYDQSQSYPYMGVNRLNGNGLISTGGVIMAPDNSGVPLLVNPDYLYNNFRTGQIKVIDASYNPNQFVDYQTFQQRQYYGNFVSLRTQFVNYDYNSLHILNAVHFNIDIATYPTRNQRYTLYPPALFQQYVRMLGINQNDYIIVYSRDTLGGMRYASAVWELFRIYNHTRISVLNGGLNAWRNAGYDLTSNIVNPQPGNWIAGFDPLKVITFEEMTAIQPNGRCYFQETALFNFLDTRTRIEFQQNGRLFGSKNFPINEIIQPNGMIMSRDDINIALSRSNYTRGQTSFVYGTNGPESSFGVLALAVIGETTARLYNGGLYEVNQRSPYILVR
uniref:Rhodanese domain-containing protein n=1 Tax=Panagrolaimus sp. PS1159 TaxID=55785 RepID=A0AC35F9V3_9BILA